MSDYRRLFIKGRFYFFTVVTHNRQHVLSNEMALKRLKAAFRYAISKHPVQHVMVGTLRFAHPTL